MNIVAFEGGSIKDRYASNTFQIFQNIEKRRALNLYNIELS